MAGIIGNALPDPTTFAQGLPDNVAGANPAAPGMVDATSYGYDSAQRTVDQATGTVAGQLQSVLASDSPLVTQARAGATATANKRGLLNSSMAAGAGESAAIAAALPIAQADAGIYDTASRDNLAATNTASQFGAGAANTASLTNAGATNSVAGAAAGRTQQAGIDTAMQNLRGVQSTELANIEANYKSLIQANSSAASYFSEMSKGIAAIMGDSKTDAATKQAGVDKMAALMRSGLSVIGSIANVDLTSLLNFG